MVGEIRDGETADLAVQAALTGHLVFTTLHTNNAATCLPRLLDMGVEPFLIASTIRVIVGQRLVRKLCPNCREEYAPDENVIARIKKIFNLNQSEDFLKLHQLEAQAIDAGIGSTNVKNEHEETRLKASTSETAILKLWKAHDGGCNKCNSSGYLGRLGIYEVLSNSDQIQKSIIKNSTSEDLEAQAILDGMVIMQIDGIVKALCGLTTVEEIMRVTSTEE
jgi:type IV pilus assembly protein PilB